MLSPVLLVSAARHQDRPAAGRCSSRSRGTASTAGSSRCTSCAPWWPTPTRCRTGWRSAERGDRPGVQDPERSAHHDGGPVAAAHFHRRASAALNVLRGEMSLVGPRPLPTRDVHRFTEAALMRRFSVRPGLTCLWQISGRSALSFDDWIRLDLQYIDEWSMAARRPGPATDHSGRLKGTGAS